MDQMDYQRVVAVALLIGVGIFIRWLRLGYSEKMAQRAKMPAPVREQLEQNDAIWQQRY